MTVSLKFKLTALISLLVLMVVLATSVLYVFSFVSETLISAEQRGRYLLDTTSRLVQAVAKKTHLPAGANPADTDTVRSLVQAQLRADPGLQSQMELAVAFASSIAYIAVTDPHGIILAHSFPDRIGQPLSAAQPLSELVGAGSLRQLLIIRGQPQVFEVDEPFLMRGQPLCTLHVGTSTVFLDDQIAPRLRKALELACAAVLIATLGAALLSFRVLRPLETISREVDLMARGEFPEPARMARSDEWGVLSSKLNLLGEHIRGEKAAFVALKENLDQLFSNLTDGLLLFDSRDRLALATAAVARFLGRHPEELVGRSPGELFSGGGPLEQLLREAFQACASFPWRTVEQPVAAETRRVSVSVQFVREQGRSVATLVTLRDASSLAQLQDQLDIATKLAALGRLTSGVAHEVKNPLNAMVLQLEILKAKLGPHAEAVKPYLQTLFGEIRRLDRVVKTFLDFARPVELRPTDTDIETLVHQVFTLAEPQARTNKVQLIFEPNGVLPPIRLDRDLIKQALLNLVLNGCQAMPSGGQLKVVPRLLPRALQLEIADQGVGIPPEAREKIFSLYFTTKPNGTGVGLAMAYRIIQLHNGSIDFSSEVDRGTTFRVSLPL